MKKTISVKWLKSKRACSEGVHWFKNQKEKDAIKILKELIKIKRLDWANWLIVRVMDYKQYVSYAVYAAKQVLSIYELKHPDDKMHEKSEGNESNCFQRNLQEGNNYESEANYMNMIEFFYDISSMTSGLIYVVSNLEEFKDSCDLVLSSIENTNNFGKDLLS